MRGCRGKETAAPLRFAPVGMTVLLQGQVSFAEALDDTTKVSSRPERSVVEGPAVSSIRALIRSFPRINAGLPPAGLPPARRRAPPIPCENL